MSYGSIRWISTNGQDRFYGPDGKPATPEEAERIRGRFLKIEEERAREQREWAAELEAVEASELYPDSPLPDEKPEAGTFERHVYDSRARVADQVCKVADTMGHRALIHPPIPGRPEYVHVSVEGRRRELAMFTDAKQNETRDELRTIEALTGTRLAEGGDMAKFICLYGVHRKERPEVPFSEFASRFLEVDVAANAADVTATEGNDGVKHESDALTKRGGAVPTAKTADDAEQAIGSPWATHKQLAMVTGMTESRLRGCLNRAKDANKIGAGDYRDLPDPGKHKPRLQFKIHRVWPIIRPDSAERS